MDIRGDKERLEGTVTGAYKDSNLRVELDSGHEVMVYLCGKMRRFRIRVSLGDRVTVEVSGYDPDRGGSRIATGRRAEGKERGLGSSGDGGFWELRSGSGARLTEVESRSRVTVRTGPNGDTLWRA